MAWNVIAEAVLDQVFGYQSQRKFVQNLVCLASMGSRAHLGGSRQTSVPLVASAQDAIDYIDVELNGTNAGGITVKAYVEVRTANAATSVTPKIRNVTDGSDAATGAASTATNADYSGTNQKQVLTLTVPTGRKKYRLQLTPQNTTHPVFGIGYLEAYADS